MSVHVSFESSGGEEIETDWGDVPIPHVGASVSLCVCTDYAPPDRWTVEGYRTRHCVVRDVRFAYEKHYTQSIKRRTFVTVVIEPKDTA